ncbi:IclR family transcriptional regulator [Hydrogenophaga sp. OTU3427]|uniref:IclR family transcriptional regulator n=1 Tax=Hydrogenophaga sp. OTU3427 TaxID=3043856 RepID=UPI00313DE944
MHTPSSLPSPPLAARAEDFDGEADSGAGRGPRGIQSIEVGSQLLKALARSGRAMALKDLARAADLTPAKSHPYLVSFCKVGLIEQDPLSGHYGLGPLAMQLGLISLQQIDPVRLVIAELPGLALRLGNTVSAAVWGATGPVIIRVEDGPTPVRVSMRHGMPASLRTTGTGKVFAAFRERAEIEAALAEEGLPGALDEPAFAAELADIRRERMARVKDELLVGLSALAVPVFDGFGRLVLAIAAIGPSALLDLRTDSPQARSLREVGNMLSQRLGHVEPVQAG